MGSGFADAAYAQAGARLVGRRGGLVRAPDLVVKVKEPNAREVARLRSGQTLFTYLHLAPNRALTEGLLAADVIGDRLRDDPVARRLVSRCSRR